METIDVRSVIDKAIMREEEAFAFYTGLHDKVEDPQARDTLKFMAGEEQKHRDFLVAYRDGRKTFTALKMDDIVDYRLAQGLDVPEVTKDLDSASVYLVAANRELASYNFYRSLAGFQPEGELRDMLKLMAAQEMVHKEKVEYLYSNTAFPQTAGG
jgi:rubrerythrin